MQVSRRQFLTLLGASSATALLGFPLDSLALPAGAKKVIWLQGAGCTGCSVSFLNRISAQAPQTVDDILLDIVELGFHTTLMGASGDLAVQAAESVYTQGGYYLIVEGGVPTAFNGAACWAWTQNGVDMTFKDVVTRYAARAAKIVCVGTCASWGGIPAAYPNPTAVKGVGQVTGKATINIGGCPAHPDWIVWTLAQLLAGASIALDSYGRPKTLFGKKIHESCPRREMEEAKTFGQDFRCLKELGCRGPETRGNCPTQLWNGGANWCCDANAPCIGCTEPNFPVRGLMGGEGEDD